MASCRFYSGLRERSRTQDFRRDRRINRTDTRAVMSVPDKSRDRKLNAAQVFLDFSYPLGRIQLREHSVWTAGASLPFFFFGAGFWLLPVQNSNVRAH